MPEWGCDGVVPQNPTPVNTDSQTTHTPKLSSPRPTNTVRPTSVHQSLSTARPPTRTVRPPTITRRPFSATSQPRWRTLLPPVITVQPPLSFIPQPGGGSGHQPSNPSQGTQTNQGPTASPGGGSPSFPSPILITFSRHAISPTRNTGNNAPFSVFGPFSRDTKTTAPPPRSIVRPGTRWSPNASSVAQPPSTFDSNLGGSSVIQTCEEGVTCVLPSCTCKSLLPPAGISVKNTPQIVYLTFIGKFTIG